MEYVLVCNACGKMAAPGSFKCTKCGSVLEVKYKYSKAYRSKGGKGILRYSQLLPSGKLVSLKEGQTPLRRLKMHGALVLAKIESGNPTNTFKDRGSAVEISKALEARASRICAASTGNMGLSLAHYARKFGLGCTIFMGKGSNGKKVRKIKNEGAEVRYVNGDFNTALKAAEKQSLKDKSFLCGDYHFRKEGQKTIAFEIAEQCKGKMPEYLFMPVGNGTLFSGVCKGFKEFMRYGLIDKPPRLVAVQSYGCDPVVRAYASGTNVRYVRPRTKADAIAVGYPTFGREVLDSIRFTKGSAVGVSESEISKAMALLARQGVSAELGAATGMAGFLKMSGELKGRSVAVVVTGNNEERLN